MAVLLATITLFSYLFGAFALLTAFTPPASDIQIILAGIFFTCGTVSLVGLCLLYRITALANRK